MNLVVTVCPEVLERQLLGIAHRLPTKRDPPTAHYLQFSFLFSPFSSISFFFLLFHFLCLMHGLFRQQYGMTVRLKMRDDVADRLGQ